jgi:hypothetical protein
MGSAKTTGADIAQAHILAAVINPRYRARVPLRPPRQDLWP